MIRIYDSGYRGDCPMESAELKRRMIAVLNENIRAMRRVIGGAS